jgi:hypothetical protein
MDSQHREVGIPHRWLGGHTIALLAIFAGAFVGTTWIAQAHENTSSDEYWYGNRECDPGADRPCAADNLRHTYCWGGDFVGPPARNAADYAMGNLVDQTQFTKARLDCDPQIDVSWHKFEDPGFYGRYDCVDASGTASPRSCQKARVLLNTELLNSQVAPQHNREHFACHEIGHSGGLKHYPAGEGSDCMRNGLVTSGHRHYNAHHIGHLNQNDF